MVEEENLGVQAIAVVKANPSPPKRPQERSTCFPATDRAFRSIHHEHVTLPEADQVSRDIRDRSSASLRFLRSYPDRSPQPTAENLLHFRLQLPAKGAVLERCEERVHLGERPAMGGFQFLHGADATGEIAL
jgi:hypothetical protein